MKKQKYLITWYTQLENGFIHERHIICKSKQSTNIMHDKLAKQEKTLSIEVEELDWNTHHTTGLQSIILIKSSH